MRGRRSVPIIVTDGMQKNNDKKAENTKQETVEGRMPLYHFRFHGIMKPCSLFQDCR